MASGYENIVWWGIEGAPAESPDTGYSCSMPFRASNP